MKIVKITLHGGLKLFVPFDELNTFDAYKDYYKIAATSQSRIFFKKEQ